MDISGSYDIPASRATVWAAINDPEVLKACIPGCDEMTADGDSGFSAKVTAKIGPVKATFSGAVRLEDVQAPASYTITGEGKGGAAGFAKGQAKVQLEELDAGTTRLTYSVDAQVGGKLAQVGSRLIQGAAKKYADDFFSTLVARLSDPAAGAEPSPPADTASSPEEAAPAHAAAPSHSTAPAVAAAGGTHWAVYAAGLLVIAAAAYLLLR
ncbi:CoxG family protein [Novispirillum itersonii]|uniref:Carbon monoxide dehydrogenase n=1 Tax=Novispirillum itersonii TaxID=189 RepID=A0A7W9ZL15_NOVIT|nr:carbon monoxide dehydrogenase subunit G [Novispirillum itersonii]MBB6212184.1 hypothetical protein [Novispirillum itersonii]